jgi:hypothetical protein
MLIKYGGLVGDARGSLGGTTFARNHYGSYARQRTKPVDPGTSKQNVFRARLTEANTTWQAFTQAQRDLWNAKASTTTFTNRLGDTFSPTGINLFVRSFNLLDIAGLAQVTVPPISPIISEEQVICSYAPPEGFFLMSTVARWEAGAKLLVWYAYDKTPSTYFYKGPYPNTVGLLAAGFIGSLATLVENADLAADTSMFAAWRLVQADGGASSTRRARTFKPPA